MEKQESTIARRKAQERYSGSIHPCAREQFNAFLEGWEECEKHERLTKSINWDKQESRTEEEKMIDLLIKHDSRPLQPFFAERDVLKAMQEYAELYSRERVEDLEKQLAFEIGVANSQTQINVELSQENEELESKLSTLEETLKAADEVIECTLDPNRIGTPARLALEKYNSLKEKT